MMNYTNKSRLKEAKLNVKDFRLENTSEKNMLFISLSSYTILKNSIHNDILNHLKHKFQNIFVFCYGDKEYQQEENITYFSGNFWRWYKKLKQLPKIDDIYINDFFLGGLFGIYAKERYKEKSCKLVFRCASPWKYELNSLSAILKTIIIQLTKPVVIRNCDRVIYNSKSIIQRQYKHHWKVVYNGVNTNLFRPMIVPKISQKLNLIAIGNINKEKGLDYLFEAVKNMQDDVYLTIVGEGPLLKYYQQKYSWVNFVGRIPKEKLPELTNKHDLLVHPSYVESMPNVVLEAMACGKLVIAANIYGIPEIVKDKDNGLLVLPKNIQTLQQAIQYCLDHPKLVVQMGQKARSCIEDHCTLRKQIQKLYKSLFLSRN